MATTAVMVTASLFEVALSALGTLVTSDCPPTSWTALGVTLLSIEVLTLLAATWSLVLLLSGPRIDPTTEAGDTAFAGQEPVDELGVSQVMMRLVETTGFGTPRLLEPHGGNGARPSSLLYP